MEGGLGKGKRKRRIIMMVRKQEDMPGGKEVSQGHCPKGNRDPPILVFMAKERGEGVQGQTAKKRPREGRGNNASCDGEVKLVIEGRVL